MEETSGNPAFQFGEAARFWERQRLWYNGALFVVVLCWLVFTWPHFRPALTLEALGKMLVLALLANVCYSAAYVLDFFMQAALPRELWRRVRWTFWVAGLLLAILAANYWIADEIYPDIHQKQEAVMLGSGEAIRGGVELASNVNFPAPLGVMGFLGACLGLFVAVAAVLIFWFGRKPKFARIAAIAIGGGGICYFALLFGLSAGSHETLLTRGQEKYFCEIDCHLAYSVVDVSSREDGPLNDYVVTLRTRFDEKTTSPSRPRDAALTPSPREVRMMDSNGREYAMVTSSGTSLMTPLTPASSYTTQLEFKVPKDARGLRLLIATMPGWPDHFVIGDENSLGHKKTYFAL
jgi:hypothetical protein